MTTFNRQSASHTVQQPLRPRSFVQQLVAAALIASASLCSSAYALTQTFQPWADALGLDVNAQYQGTRVITTQDTTFEYAERRMPQKMLMDIQMDGVQAILLVREDLDKSYVLMPSMGMYREMKMDKANQQAGGLDSLEEVTKVGRETLNGYDCTKYKAKIRSKDGKGDGFIWVTDSGVPMKMDMVYSSRRKRGEHMVMELKDLELTPQDPSLFELPADLKPFGLRGLGQLFKRQ